MRKTVIFLATLLLITLFLTNYLNAQSLYNLYDPIYKDLELWDTKGYIESLPLIRPYPAQLVKDLLLTVIEKGNPTEVIKARDYYAGLDGGVSVGSELSMIGMDATADPLIRASLAGDFLPEDWLALSLAFDVWALTKEKGEETRIPGIYSAYPDLKNDQSDLGIFTILMNFNSIMALGNSRLYFQAGLNRSSFGPFTDNGVVVGPQAPHAGHFSLVYKGDKWSASIMHLALAASYQDGSELIPNKHMVLHSFDFKPLPNLELGIFESVIYGDRLELLYLAPFTFLFQSQSVIGFWDNCFIGLQGSWKPGPGLKLMAQVYVDDIHFNDLLRLQFDTKYKLAAQLGLSWAPDNTLLKNLKFDYSAIMPYMYSHIWNLEEEDFQANYELKPNFSNYLHMGEALGTELLPNSDRLSIRTAWALLPAMELRLGAEFIRHGNASDWQDWGLKDPIFTQGDYIDDGYDENGYPTFQHKTRFLTQSHIEYTLRTNLALSYAIKTRLGLFSMDAAMVLMYGWNLKPSDNGLHLLYYAGTSWKL